MLRLVSALLLLLPNPAHAAPSPEQPPLAAEPGEAAAAPRQPPPAQIALYYSGWQLVGQREDQPTVGDVNNVSRARELVARGFTHGMLAHGNDATIAAGASGQMVATYGTNCSGWTPASHTCQINGTVATACLAVAA